MVTAGRFQLKMHIQRHDKYITTSKLNSQLDIWLSCGLLQSPAVSWGLPAHSPAHGPSSRWLHADTTNYVVQLANSSWYDVHSAHSRWNTVFVTM